MCCVTTHYAGSLSERLTSNELPSHVADHAKANHAAGGTNAYAPDSVDVTSPSQLDRSHSSRHDSSRRSASSAAATRADERSTSRLQQSVTNAGGAVTPATAVAAPVHDARAYDAEWGTMGGARGGEETSWGKQLQVCLDGAWLHWTGILDTLPLHRELQWFVIPRMVLKPSNPCPTAGPAVNRRVCTISGYPL